MAILPMSLSVSATPQSLSSKQFLSGGQIWNQSLCLTGKFSHLSLKTTPIRMGGGPRTYPGGVSKWQWKRMQAKKAKQLLKARLARERQIYEMRKRAELKAAVSELERPWEVVEKPPNLFSVSADEQLKVLADRFQKPGGLDLWTDSDGPELFRPDNGLPSSRFFPKGVVHSIRPYRKTGKPDSEMEEFEGSGLEEYSALGGFRENDGELGLEGNSRSGRGGMSKGGSVRGLETRSEDGLVKEGEKRNLDGNFRKKETRRVHVSDSEGMGSRNAGFYDRNDGRSRRPVGSSTEFRRRDSVKRGQDVNSDMFDMNLQNDGFVQEGENRNINENFRKGTRRMHVSDSEGMGTRNAGFYDRNDGRSRRPVGSSTEFRRRDSVKRGQDVNSDMFDMNLQNDGFVQEGENRNINGNFRKGTRRMHVSDSEGMGTRNAGFYDRNDGRSRGPVGSSREFRRSSSVKRGQDVNSDVFDMNLQNDGLVQVGENRNFNGVFRKKETRRGVHVSDSEGMGSRNAGFHDRNDRRSRRPAGSSEFRRRDSVKKGQDVKSDVFNMNLQNDGSYGFEL